MAENRWQRIKQWFVASDPDDVAREAYRLATEDGAEPPGGSAAATAGRGRLTHEPA